MIFSCWVSHDAWTRLDGNEPSAGGCGNKNRLARRNDYNLSDAGAQAGGRKIASLIFHGETIMVSNLDSTGSTRWFLI